MRNLTSLDKPRDNATTHDTASKVDLDCIIDENDIVIAVMGLTGTGRSSFVSTAVGRAVVEIGDDLKSKTRQVLPVRCTLPDCRRSIVLVDTPGFDDTYMSDAQILRTIAGWLKVTYQNNIKLAGIICLHRITDHIWSRSYMRYLTAFKDLCGESNLKNVILVTTMWDEIETLLVGYKREEELRSTHWRDMIRVGSRTCRFEGSRESALDIINRFNLESSRETRAPLLIQKEMVDQNMSFGETTAARNLRREEPGKARGRLRLPRKFYRKTSAKKQSAHNPYPPRPPSRSSTISSSVSEIGSSDSSNVSRIFSSGSPQPSIADSTATGCSSDYRGTLAGLVAGLRLAYQVADIAGVPMLRGSIGMVLQITQMVEGMGGTHHMIDQVLEQSGWLLEEIVQYATESKLSKNMERTLRTFEKELENLQYAVRMISTRSPVFRFFLYDADVRTLTEITTAIKAIYDKLEVRLAIENYQAIARIQNQLDMLCDRNDLRRCECGKLVVSEESRDSGQPSQSL